MSTWTEFFLLTMTLLATLGIGQIGKGLVVVASRLEEIRRAIEAQTEKIDEGRQDFWNLWQDGLETRPPG